MEKPSIGILAGMGPRSTGPFIDMVVTECQRQYGARDDIDFPKMMICSQPAPFYEDRPVDDAALEEAIRSGLQDLERTGVDFLAIACNTVHIYPGDRQAVAAAIGFALPPPLLPQRLLEPVAAFPVGAERRLFPDQGLRLFEKGEKRLGIEAESLVSGAEQEILLLPGA